MSKFARRRVAVVVPARDEATRISGCLQHLENLITDARVADLQITLLANNCQDDTADVVREFAARSSAQIAIRSITLPPEHAHAGWARRSAFEAGAEGLTNAEDLLLCTDADTRVARDWLVKTLDHIDAGFDAVAGFARLDPRELRLLCPSHRRRLAAIRRYDDACCYLKASQTPDEPWPRHFYEGGASMALNLKAYSAIGGAPTPRVGEDKAVFDALRAKGRRIRHAKDVRVLTSCRVHGRAPDGAADTLARWCMQNEGEDLTGVEPMATVLGQASANDDVLTFQTLAAETTTARALVRALRSKPSLADAI